MFEEDLTLFYDVSDFAVEVTLDGKEVTGILFNPYVESDFVQSSAPSFSIKTADVPDVSHSSVLVTEAKKYNVTGVFPDATGNTILELRETS